MKNLTLDDIKFYPAIPFTLAMAFGILIQDFSPLPLFFLLSVSTLSLLFIVFLYRRGLLRLIPLLSLIIGYCTGSTLYSLSIYDFEDDPFHQPKISHIKLTATVNRISELNSDKINFTGSVYRVIYDSTFKDSGTGKRTKIRLTKEFKNGVEFVFKLGEPEDSLLKILNEELIPGRIVNLTGGFSTPLNRRNPGGFDYHDYLKRQLISGIIHINQDSLITFTGDYAPISGSIYLLRKNIGQLIDKFHSAPTAAILRGLIIADRTEIDEEVVNGYINTGIAHILAVSGFNVAVIYLLTLLLFQKLRYRSRITELVLRLIILFLFLTITQFQTTVVRAVLMFTVHSLLFYSGRLNNRWNTLAITTFLILVINPQDIFSVSFQLSVVAVSSLFIADTIFSEIWFNIRSKIVTMQNKSRKEIFIKIYDSFLMKESAQLIILTLLVQFGMLPFLIIYFGKMSLLSLPANLVAVPISSGLLINGIVTLLVSPLSSTIATLFATGSEFANYLLDYYIFTLNKTHFGTINYGSFTFFDGIVFYLLILLLIIVFTRKKSWVWRCSTFFIAVIIFTTSHLITRPEYLKSGYSHIMVIDVGQGDCYLIQTPENRTILIDAGKLDKTFDAGKSIVIPVLHKLGIKKIDVAIVSHYDNDHAGGMISLLRAGLIDKLLLPPPDTLNVDDITLFRMLAKHQNVEIIQYGNIFSKKQFEMDLLTDFDSIPKSSESNRRSAVIMVKLENQKILFTGDLDKNGEMELIRKNINLKCDLLKVGHHGSRFGTGNEFLDVTQPSFALISAGVANRYNHPHPLVIERLENKNTQIFRTDLEGALIFRIENDKIMKVNWR
jgi:competence protein ComEC